MKNKIFITSDHHFWHKKILEYEDRPFDSVEDMNMALVWNWNERVKEEDVVIHLGDFSLGNSAQTKEVIAHLNGRKRIVLGSHDRKAGWFERNGFEKAYGGQFNLYDKYVLSHEPLEKKDLRFKMNIHGHLHSKTLDDKYYCNVCVELWDFKPVSLDYLIQRRG